mmetsp:Transcript_169129/g.543628  ORF Transcript_169129/g.543628 Transcript_169129/m.543628 type:complete len:279 (-) Transcript_169129:48-884(-)
MPQRQRLRSRCPRRRRRLRRRRLRQAARRRRRRRRGRRFRGAPGRRSGRRGRPPRHNATAHSSLATTSIPSTNAAPPLASLNSHASSPRWCLGSGPTPECRPSAGPAGGHCPCGSALRYPSPSGPWRRPPAPSPRAASRRGCQAGRPIPPPAMPPLMPPPPPERATEPLARGPRATPRQPPPLSGRPRACQAAPPRDQLSVPAAASAPSLWRPAAGSSGRPGWRRLHQIEGYRQHEASLQHSLAEERSPQPMCRRLKSKPTSWTPTEATPSRARTMAA